MYWFNTQILGRSINNALESLVDGHQTFQPFPSQQSISLQYCCDQHLIFHANDSVRTDIDVGVKSLHKNETVARKMLHEPKLVYRFVKIVFLCLII